jgi:hypothetical protein
MIKFKIQYGMYFDDYDVEIQDRETETYEIATEAELEAFWLKMRESRTRNLRMVYADGTRSEMHRSAKSLAAAELRKMKQKSLVE